ncbi:MAG: DUF2730 family protein [Cypionkella sp.]
MDQTQVLNISPIVIWVVALSQLLTFGLTIWGLIASGSRANAQKIIENRTRIDNHDLRLNSVEQSIKASPTDDDMQAIALAMEAMRGSVNVMRAEMSGSMAIMSRLEAIVSRHENHLLDGRRS